MNKRHLDHLLAIYDDLAPDERQRVDDAMAEQPHLAAKLATYRAQDRALDDFARFQARRLDPKWSDEMNTQSMLAAQPATQRGPTARLHTPRVDQWLHRLLHSPVSAFQFAAASAVVVMIASVSLLLAGVEPPAALTAAFGQATPTAEPEAVDVTGEGVVRFLCDYNSPNDCSSYNELVEQFEAEHPDVQVELVRRQSIPGLAGPSGGPLAQEVLDDVAARVDVGLGWLFLVGNSDPSRSLVDLAPYIEAQPGMSRADFFPGVLDSPQDDNSVWALPTSFAPVLLYYNKNIFDEAGVPYPTAAWTQENFLRAAEQLTKRNGERITQAGFADPLGQGRNLFVDAALGTQDISGLTSPALVEAVRWYTALQTEHRVMRDLPDTFGRLSVEARSAIGAGNVAMWVDSPLYPIVSRRPTSGNPMDWGATDVPSPYAPTGLFFGEGFAISAQAAEPAAAWQWIEFLSRHPIDIEPPSDSEYAMPQGFPTRRSVAEATDFWRYWTEQERADIENALTELASQGERWNEQAYKLSEGLYTAYGIINQSLLANNSVDVREALAQAQAQFGVTLQTREQTPIEEQSMFLDPAPYVYTMQEGDTLYRVATRYASRVEWIVEANKLADADDFQVGDELIIPNARVFVGEAGASTDSAIRPAPITVGYANLEADAIYALYRSRQDSAPLVDAMRGAELEQSLRLPVVGRSADSAWLRICCYNGELVWLAATDVTVENMEDVPVVAAATTEDSTSAQAAEPVSLTGEGVVRFGCITEFECELYEPLLEEFQTENPSIEVELVALEDLTTFPTNKMPEDNLLEVASSRTDVFQAWFYLTEADQASRYLLDLDPYIEAEPGMTSADFYPQTLSISQRDNGTWVLPTSFSPALLYYNKDIFDEAGLDYPTAEWTQDDFLQAAKQLTQRDGELFTQQGFADHGNWGLDLFVRAALASPDVNTLTSPEMIEATSWYADLKLEHGVMRSLPGLRSGSSSVDGNSIKAGNVAMWTDSPMYALMDKRPANLASFDWGVTAVPSPYASTVVFPSDLLAISRNASNLGASWQWLEFLSRHPIYGDPLDDSESAMPQGIPTRRSVAEAGDYWRYWSAQERTDIEQALDNAAPLWFTDEAQLNVYQGILSAFDEIQQGAAVEEALAQAQLQLGLTLQTEERIEAGADPTTMDAEPLLYTVREGDTLSKIAATYNVDVETIVKANALDDLKNLAAGDELLIPGARVFVDAEGRLISDRVEAAYAFLERDGRYTLYRLPGDATPLASSLSRAELGESLRLPVVGRTEDSAWLRVCCYNGELVWLAAENVTVENLEDVPVVATAPAPEPTAAGSDLSQTENVTDFADLAPEVADLLASGSADPENGAALMAQNACVGCHLLDPTVQGAGPTLYNFGNVAAERVPGQSAEAYAYTSIVAPDEHVVEGYQAGIHPRIYENSLSDQELADLITYMLAQRQETEVLTNAEDSPPPFVTLHTVETGDTLDSIAAKYGVRVEDIYDDVAGEPVDADALQVGDELAIAMPFVKANQEHIDLREAPSAEAPLVGRLRAEMDTPLRLEVRTEDGNWLQVCCWAEQSVWVAADEVDLVGGSMEAIEVVEATPFISSDVLTASTPISTPTPFVEAAGAFATLLEGPSRDASEVALLGQGVPVGIVGRSEDDAWLQLCCISGELVWVEAASVEVTSDLTEVPMVAPGTNVTAVKNGITSPAPGDVVSDTLPIVGTATGENFKRYELHYKQAPLSDETYVYIGGGAEPVVEGKLSALNLRELPLGTYTLRLRVVDEQANYSDHFVRDFKIISPPGVEPQVVEFVYIVQAGDTLDSIVEQFGFPYGFPVHVQNILDAEMREPIDEATLEAGQELAVLSIRSGPAAGRSDAEDLVNPDARRDYTYTVQPGDALPVIAQQFAVSVEDIIEANEIEDPMTTTVGDELLIPNALVFNESSPQMPSCQETNVQITSPLSGEAVSGVVEITGAAMGERFQEYKLEWAPGRTESFNWFTGASTPVDEGVLGFLETTAIPNGTIVLRLTVVDDTGRFPPPCSVVITVQN